MKFALLKAGQAFVYKGKHYLKVTPLMAVAEDGEGQELIPRSADVTPVGNKQASPAIDSVQGPTARAIDRLEQAILQQLPQIQSRSLDEAGQLIRDICKQFRN